MIKFLDHTKCPENKIKKIAFPFHELILLWVCNG